MKYLQIQNYYEATEYAYISCALNMCRRQFFSSKTRTLLLALLFLFNHGSLNADESILVQSTTSTANSGLYDYLLPLFRESHKVDVKVVAVGTGQAIKNARNCDADVLLVHARDDEQQFVDEGFGIERFDLMYNDFVFVGPDTDPADISSASDLTTALQRIATNSALFASRGDDSGTHKKEQALWMNAAIEPDGKWYRSTGSGMGATLNTGIGLGAYIMTDRATWISFGNKADYKIVFEGDESLFNQYGIVQVDSDSCPDVNADGAMVFVEWMLSATGQKAIADYSMDGQQLFFPNASPVDN